MKYFFKFHLPPILWGIIIILVSSIPSDKIPDIQIFGVDKIVHIIIFFIFGVLVFRSINFWKGKYQKFYKIAIYTILVIAVFGIFDELYQGFIPGRSTDVFDFIADVLGGILSLFYAKKNLFVLTKENYS